MSDEGEAFSWRGFDVKLAAHRLLQEYLVVDVQYSARHAREIREGIGDYRDGVREAFSEVGNGYELECMPGGVEIAPLYECDEIPPVVIDFDTVIGALREWEAFCER